VHKHAHMAVGVGLQIFLLLLISACTFGVYQVVIPLTWTYKTTAGDACSAYVYQYVWLSWLADCAQSIECTGANCETVLNLLAWSAAN